MSNWLGKDSVLSGFLFGAFVIAGLYMFLKWLDNLIHMWWGRPLFTKPDALQLIILATLTVVFRQKFKTERMENGKGVFLATFLATMAYFVWKKTNFAGWQDFD